MTQSPQPKNIHYLPIEYRHGIHLCDLHQLIVDIAQRFLPANDRNPTAAQDIKVAAEGERDPARLRSEALSTVVTSAL